MAKRVTFKTKRGRRVSFTAGGKRRKGGRTAQQNKMARAAKACRGKGPIGGKTRTACIVKELRKGR